MSPDAETKLVTAVSNVSRKDLAGSGPKTEFLQFRVSKAEKESIQNTATKLGIQVSEYILKLHEIVTEKINKD